VYLGTTTEIRTHDRAQDFVWEILLHLTPWLDVHRLQIGFAKTCFAINTGCRSFFRQAMLVIFFDQLFVALAGYLNIVNCIRESVRKLLINNGLSAMDRAIPGAERFFALLSWSEQGSQSDRNVGIE
jgi:hypothetical protein